MEETSNTYRIQVKKKPLGKRPLGMPRWRTLENGIIEFRRKECEDGEGGWIQNRVQCRALVSAVLNGRVLPSRLLRREY
jgi:hypothetical protein